ncbi:MAG: hypothetical protein FWG59_07090 [Betaproteobacteria bacterium]|nr:hypothetical protein [Betaproteobacteria bacterium]
MYDTSLNQLLDSLSAMLGFTVSLELLFAAFVLVLIAGFLAAFLRKRNLTLRHALQRKRIVQELFLNAIGQRSTMELEFSSEDMHGRVLSGACSSIENDVVTVDVGIEHSLQTWIGEPVEVSFKLDYKSTTTYYRFFSQIIGMRAGPRAVSIELSLPPHVHPMQKRHYVRINPLPSHILGMGLWSLEPTQPLPLDSTNLGNAALSHRPGKLTQCSLINLSAGGMRLGVPQALLQQLPLSLTLHSQLLCLLLLRSPNSGHPMPFWLACAIVSLVEDEDTFEVIIGTKFKAWALSETGNSNIFWFPAGKSGEVSPLASWVLRHQLEQNRRRE